MILIKNTQRKIFLDIPKIHHEVENILQILGYAGFDLGIWFTSDATIRTYNRQYRHQDKPTDVLSFPYHSELKAGEQITVTHPDDKNLGDLIVSPAYVERNAQELGVTFEHRLRVILIHGICHLLGYDHIKDEDYMVMHAKEQDLLKKLSTLQ